MLVILACRCLSPFLKILEMFASLQSLSSSSVYKEHCSMVFSIGARCIAHSFNIRFGILSGPDAFAGFMLVNSFSRPF
jgi:hypothetical protein